MPGASIARCGGGETGPRPFDRRYARARRSTALADSALVKRRTHVPDQLRNSVESSLQMLGHI